ncbi:unnamed protein product [Ostreobium quekettii]|uniref:non-specific serine/threonine protein kinase n=1 Tax=Ostreobium quekettii TaxID=121088 RepID=A0A8S1J373_9CHLO|nr:unnamed protein product [Ostreobium quekettii]|eukprot:evm.model.scf_462.10 EVM.evm.TU.scf_462.10   scf_462:74972-77537(-)
MLSRAAALALCALLVCLAARAPPARAQKGKGKDEAYVAPVFKDDPHVGKLSKGKPVDGTLALGQLQLLGFSVPKRDGLGFPDILLSLEASAGGDADVYCLPLVVTPDNRFAVPNRANAVWRSVHTVGTDYLFVSRNHSQILDGVTKVTEGGNVTEVTSFVCSVVGLSTLPVDFRVELDVDYESRALVPAETAAVEAIMAKCCSGERGCSGWQHAERSLAGSNTTDAELPVDLCHVHGNVCDGAGRLKRLHMVAYGLECEFPAEEMAAFTRLEKLSAGGNRFTGDIGKIAEQLVGLKKLEELSIAVSAINGTIDDENICRLAQNNLQLLNLEFNRITGQLPACLFNESSKLSELHLDSNPLSSTIPDVFPQDSNMQHLSLVGTQLSGGLPDSMKQLTQLRTLDLGFNNLTGEIPEEIGTSESLVSVRMESNKLVGKVPSSFAKSTSLIVLTLNNNSFTELPQEWTEGAPKGNRMIEVTVRNNKLKGTFPTALASQPSLAILDLSGNMLDGRLAGGEGLFSRTWLINLSGNKFSGSIPESWDNAGLFNESVLNGLRSFPVLDLSDNELSGNVPDYMLNVTELPFQIIAAQAISLGGNDLECPEGDPEQYQHIKGLVEQCA